MNTRKVIGWGMLADGALGLVWPTRYLRLLEVGPAPVRRFFEDFAQRPELTRAACVAELALGALLIGGAADR